MIVQFQGPNGPIFVHRDNIVTIATTPSAQFALGKHQLTSTTVLTLDTGATLTINDDPLHAAEKWEKAFEEDFEDLDDEMDEEEEQALEALRAAERALYTELLLLAGDESSEIPDLAGMPETLRAALSAWLDAMPPAWDDDADDWDDAADDDEEDDDADA